MSRPKKKRVIESDDRAAWGVGPAVLHKSYSNFDSLPNTSLRFLGGILGECGLFLGWLHWKTSIFMGSMIGDWPSYNPHNFSQLRPSDPSTPSKMTLTTYHPTHNQTLPPPDQVITTESKNILLRQMYQRAEEKLRPKRAASEHLLPEHGCKQQRASVQDPSN
ncbi:hypothetical protein F8388_018044 [Cannabis sativa]|uniref:DET1- and DDB1-associated protein 1 domain-containing protein n=1 Tax=Cannabis sativa TaxID=3483 RepID=A0A7J6EAK4_CANSA|nr:hypothetical protein F8388_018044 [Cannabis sativa]